MPASAAVARRFRRNRDRITAALLGPQVVGGRYRCGYWLRNYTVVAIGYHPEFGYAQQLTVRWEDTGAEATHMTSWDRIHDRVLPTGDAASCAAWERLNGRG